MSLNTSTLAQSINNGYLSLLETGSIGRQAYTTVWNNAYYDYADGAIGDISTIANPASTIGDALFSMVGYEVSNVDILAQSIAEYWSNSHLTPKAPAVSIIGNNALSKVGDIKTAILNARTDQLKLPPFKHLFDAIEPIIKTIVWTGTNSSGGTITGNVT